MPVRRSQTAAFMLRRRRLILITVPPLAGEEMRLSEGVEGARPDPSRRLISTRHRRPPQPAQLRQLPCTGETLRNKLGVRLSAALPLIRTAALG